MGPQKPCQDNGRVNRVQFVISLMMKGRNNGKKLLALRIVAHAFEIIHLLTDQNPIQVRLPNGTSDSALI
jgi:ribosomal protein S7